jgi:formamidopyrimidine-DNA glycosylase
MPELPEVETVVRGLQATLPGRRVVDVRLGKTDFIEDPSALERELPGRRVANVRRYGKFIVLSFDALSGSEYSGLLIHLGMTGQIVLCPPNTPVRPHTHVFMALDDGREFRYTDIRRFGSMGLLPNGSNGSGPEMPGRELGTDPLEATEHEFETQLSGRRARIKALLLDQRVLRGMGNIYTDESLWRARIHPARIAADLTDKELRGLYRAVQWILNEAIRLRGSSVSDYVDSEGQRGEFQLKHRVYQRRGKKCFRCGTAIERMIVAGRSSYFCPRCQRAPRSRARKKKAHARR